jgi:CRP/FNR family cyclic AMP-dependent transcriptional regulator
VKALGLIRNVPLFSCLDDAELEGLLAAAVRKTFARHTILLNAGDTTDSLYVITEGKVKAVIIDEHGKEIILSISGPGEYFGEMAMIDGEPRSATIMTREPTELLIFSKADLRRVFSQNPDIVFNLLKGLTRRLRKANQQIESLALMDVYGRVATLLSESAQPQGAVAVVPEALTHQEIANMVGSSREMVSRILNELARGGYIQVEKKIITILKKLPYSW